MKKKTVKNNRFTMYSIVISICLGYYLYFVGILVMTQY